MSSGGSKTQKVTTTTNTSPWGPTQPGLQQGISDLTSLYNSGQFLKANQAYPGQTIADLAPETTQSWNNTTALASDNSTIGNALNYNNSVLSGDLSSGFLGNLANNVTNKVNGQYSLAGRYGSGAHQNAISSGITSAVMPYAQAAAANAPALDQARYYGANQLANVGTARQGYAQDLINSQIQAYNQNQSAPIAGVTDFMQALSGNWGGATNSTQPVQGSNTNPYLTYGGLGLSLLGSFLGS